MSLLTRKTAITKFKVNFVVSAQDTLLMSIALKMFKPIDDTYDDFSVGFVPINDMLGKISSDGSNIIFGDLYVFSMRYDERKIPSALLKAEIAKAERAKLEELQIPRLARSAKAAIKAAVKLSLCRKIPPTPTVVDVIVSVNDGEIYLCTSKTAEIELFEALFKETFLLSQLSPQSVFPETINSAKFLQWLYSRENVEPVIAKMSDASGVIATLMLPEAEIEAEAAKDAGRLFESLRFYTQNENGVPYTATLDGSESILAVNLPLIKTEEDEDDGGIYASAASVMDCSRLVCSLVSEYQEFATF